MDDQLDESVTLSRLRPDQVDDLHAIQSDPRTWTHSPGQRPVDVDSTRDLVARSERSWREHGQGLWSVALDGDVVGIAGVTMLDLGVWNLYYRFLPEAGGRGLARQAARRAVTEAQLRSPHHPVTARILANNPRSAKVALAAGLTPQWRGPVGLETDRLIHADRPLDAHTLAALIALG